MKRFIIIAAILSLVMFIACGGGNGGATKAKGEAKVVANFMDSALKKGDLSAAFNMLCDADKAMLGMMPGLKDFIEGKNNADAPEEMRLMRVLLKEIVPVPENLISYEFGEPIGEGDTIMVPVTFMFPKEDLEDFAKKHMDEELIEKMDNLDQLDIPFSEKEKIIKIKREYRGIQFSPYFKVKVFLSICQNIFRYYYILLDLCHHFFCNIKILYYRGFCPFPIVS